MICLAVTPGWSLANALQWIARRGTRIRCYRCIIGMSGLPAAQSISLRPPPDQRHSGCSNKSIDCQWLSRTGGFCHAAPRDDAGSQR